MNHQPPAVPAGDVFTTPDLLVWSSEEIVLVAQREGDRWICARGWRDSDRLTDVRRWSFTTAPALANQFRRLAREATGSHLRAHEAATAAFAWIALSVASGEAPSS